MAKRLRITLEDNTGKVQNFNNNNFNTASVSVSNEKNKNVDQFKFVTGVDSLERKTEFKTKNNPDNLINPPRKLVKNKCLIWNKKHKSLCNLVDHTTNNYYSYLPLKPGIGFYKALANTNYPLKNLKIRIPYTFCSFDLNYFIFNGENGNIEINNQENIRSFYEILKDEKIGKSDFKKFSNEPAVAVRAAIGYKSGAMDCEIISWHEFKMKAFTKIDSDVIIQEYVQPFKRKAILYRLIYYTNPAKSLKAPYAIVVVNRNSINDETTPFKKRTLITFKENSCDIYNEPSSNLPQLNQIAKEIVNFMTYGYGYRVVKVVLDFLHCSDSLFYFIGLRSFDLEEDNYAVLTSGISPNPKIQSSEATLTASRCRLCNLKFKLYELNKRLPLKMLFDLRSHLQKRGIFLFDQLKNVAPEFLMHGCRVCSICYQLCVSEYQLSEIESKYANALSIPKTKIKDGENIERPIGLPSKLYQWRVLLYLKSFEDFDLNAIKCTSRIFLRNQFFPNSLTSIPINSKLKIESKEKSEWKRIYETEMKKAETQRNLKALFTMDILISKLRVHYFFTDVLELDSFFEKFYTQIYVGIENNNENPLIYGQFHPFNNFSSGFIKSFGSETDQKKVILFSVNGAKVVFNCSIGITFDKTIDTSALNLYRLKNYPVYYTDDSYINSFELPSSWIDLLKNQTDNLNENLFKQDNIDLKYNNVINSKEAKILAKNRFKIIEGFGNLNLDSNFNLNLNLNLNPKTEISNITQSKYQTAIDAPPRINILKTALGRQRPSSSSNYLENNLLKREEFYKRNSIPLHPIEFKVKKAQYLIGIKSRHISVIGNKKYKKYIKNKKIKQSMTKLKLKKRNSTSNNKTKNSSKRDGISDNGISKKFGMYSSSSSILNSRPQTARHLKK